MSNNKNFVVKNGLSVGTRYLQTGGTETAGTEGYSLGSASYDSVSFSFSSQTTSPRGVTFNNDGTKMFVMGTFDDAIFQYSLSTAFDVSTASYDSVTLDVSSEDGSPNGLTFNSSGTKMYIVGAEFDNVYQYTLSTAFDLSTASYDSVSLDISGQTLNGLVVVFNNDGTKMFLGGITNDSVYQYSLSTAFDLSTASYDSVSLDVSGQDSGTVAGLAFNSNGTKMYVVGFDNDSVYQYSLSTAFDLSTASYDSVSFSVASQDTTPRSVLFNSDGTKMYIGGDTNDTIYQYSTVAYTQTLDLSTGSYFSFTPSGATTVSFTNAPASGKAVGFAVEINGDGSAITWPTSVKWHGGTAPTATASKEVYAFVTTDGGTSYYGKLAGSDIA